MYSKILGGFNVLCLIWGYFSKVLVRNYILDINMLFSPIALYRIYTEIVKRKKTWVKFGLLTKKCGLEGLKI